MPDKDKKGEVVTDQALLDELNSESTPEIKSIAQQVDESLYNNGLPVDKREFIKAQLRHETGKADFESDVAKKNNNVSGITWNENFPEDWKGSARPEDEGGNYVHFPSYNEWAKEHIKLLKKDRGAGAPIEAQSIKDYAHRLKKNGYYTAPESVYANGMESAYKKYGSQPEVITDPELLKQLEGGDQLVETQKKSPSGTGLAENLQNGPSSYSNIEGIPKLDTVSHLPILGEQQPSETKILPGPLPQTQPLADQTQVSPESDDINHPWDHQPLAGVSAPSTSGISLGITGKVDTPIQAQPKKLEKKPEDIKAETAKASNFIANDIISNLNDLPKEYADNIGGIKMDEPGNVVYDITNPHGNPEMTAGYLNTRIAQVNRDYLSAADQARTSMMNDAHPDMSALSKVENEHLQKVNQLKDNFNHIIDLQVANKAYENKDFDPVKIGIQRQKLMGDKRAIKDQIDYDNKKPLDKNVKFSYEAIGLNALQNAKQNVLANDQQAAAEQFGEHSDDPQRRLEKNNPEVFRESIIQQIGNYKYKHENPITNGFLFSGSKMNQQEFDAAVKELGFTKKQVEGIKPEDIPTSAGVLNQAAQGFVNTAGGDLYESGLRGLAGIGLANKDAVDARFHPGWKEEGGFGSAFVGKMPEAQRELSVGNGRGVAGMMAKGVGDLGAFFLGGEAGGSILKGTGLVKDAIKANKIANFTTAALPAYNDAYQRSETVIGDSPKDEWKRRVYSTLNGVIGGSIMLIDPKADIAKDILGETKAGQDLIKVLKKSDIGELATPDTKQKIAQVLKETGSHLGLQIALPAATTAAGNITDMLFDKNAHHDVMDNVGQSAISGGISMFLPSLFAGIQAPRNQNHLVKSLLWDVGNNPKEYQKQSVAQYDNGNMSLGELKMSLNNIHKAADIIKNRLPATNEITGTPLTDQQKQDYAWSLLRGEDLKDKLQKVEAKGDDAQTKLVKEQIKETENEKSDILNKAGEPTPPKEEYKPIETENDERSVATDESKKRKSSPTISSYISKLEEQYKHLSTLPGETPEAYQKHIDNLKTHPEETISEELGYYESALQHEQGKETPDNLRIKHLEREASELRELKSKIEEEKKNIAEKEKEDISLTPDIEKSKGPSQEKNTDHEQDSNGKIIREENGSENGQAKEQRTDSEVRNAAENGRIQGQEESLAQKPSSQEKAGAPKEEQPALPVSGKERRKKIKLVAEEEPIPLTKKDEFAAMDHGTHEGDDAEKVKKITEGAADDEKVGGGESFNEFKDRIKEAWGNTKETAKDKAALITHSSVMRLIGAAEKHGWDDTKALREAYNKSAEPKIGEEHTYQGKNGEIRVLRHGESEDGKQGLDRTKETPLTAKGEDQAKEVIAEKLKQDKPSEIITDEQQRTSHTAEIVHEELKGETPKVLVNADGEFTEHAKSLADESLKNASLEDINNISDGVINREKGVLVDAFGEEGYKKYKQLESVVNSSHSGNVEALKAEEELNKMHNSLTKKQKEKLSISPEEYYDPAEYKRIKRVANTWMSDAIHDAKEETLFNAIGREATTGDINKNIEDHIVFREAYKELKRRRFSDNDILNQSISERESRGDSRDHLIQLLKDKVKQVKPEENASTQSKEQQQERAKQGGEPEHARIEQAGSKEAPASAESGDSNIRSEKKKIKNQSKKGWSLTHHLERKEKVTKEEPHSMEEYILHAMLAMSDKEPQNKWALSSIEKEIPKSNKEKQQGKQSEEMTTAKQFPKATPVDVWARDIAESAGERGSDVGFIVPDESDIINMVVENITKFPNKTALLEHLENLQNERRENQEKADKEAYEKYQAQNNEPTNHELAQMYAGKDGEDFEGYDDEGHPTFKAIDKKYGAIDDSKLTSQDEQKIHDYYAGYFNEKTGQVDYDSAHFDYGAMQALKESLSPAGKAIMDEIAPFNNFEQHSETTQKLINDATEYSKKQRDSEAERQSTPEGSGASRDVKPENKSPEERLKEIDEELTRQRASQKISSQKRAAAEKERDIAESNRHNDNFYKKQEKINKLEEEKESIEKSIEKSERSENIAKSYKTAADSVRAFRKKIIKDDPAAYASVVPGISPHLVGGFLDGVADLVEKFGNLHIAIDMMYRKLREEHKDIKEHTDEDISQVESLLHAKKQKLTAEPILPINHEEYAKDLIADIFDGKISYEEARQEIRDQVIENREGQPSSDYVQAKNKAKILNYIDWHIQQDATSIKNETTRLRREQYGLKEEIPAAKKEFGETWDEARDKIEKGFDPQNLIEELSKKARPITDVENAILLHRQIVKEGEYQKLNENINKAATEGDEYAILEAKVSKARILDELQKIYDVNKAVGTENARGLATRRMMADRKYSLVNMISEKRATANDGKPLSEEQTTHIEDLHKKIQETQKAYDDYVKQSESQIIDLQRKALDGKLKDKTKASEKLRSWAERIRKAAKNQAYPSPILITPHMVADAIDIIAYGVEKGEKLVDLVKKAVKEASKANPGISEHDLEKEINKELIDSGILEPSPERRTALDISGLFIDGKLDKEAVRLKAAAERAKYKFDEELKKNQEDNIPKGKKALNFFVKLERQMKLSSPLTMAKLMAAGMARLVIHPAEEAVGGVYSKAFPKLAKGAIGEGGGLNARAYARAIASGFKMWGEDSRQIMKTGKSDLDVAFGKGEGFAPEVMEFFGQLHGAEKAPFKRVIMEYSLQKRLENAIANGVDVTDPIVMSSIGIDAYKDGNRAIFMQDNAVSDFYNKKIRELEKIDPKTGKPESDAKYAISKAMQFLIPFAKIPSNIVAESARYVYGLPVGVAKAIYHGFKGDIETLPPEEKDLIMRNLKKGTLGTAALLYGFFKYNNFGGFYQPGQDWKKKKGQADWGGAEIGGDKIPITYMEAPIFQAMQMGATLRKVMNHKIKGEEEGPGWAVWAAASGLLEENPLLAQPMHLSKLWGSRYDQKQYIGELAKSSIVPSVMSYLAKATDPADAQSILRKIFTPENKRKAPKTIGEHIKSGLPYFREDLPTKESEEPQSNKSLY